MQSPFSDFQVRISPANVAVLVGLTYLSAISSHIKAVIIPTTLFKGFTYILVEYL